VRGPPVTDVVVVGAGIVGASVAYHAARAGAAVLLIDRSLPASGVTGDSFAWVRGPSAPDARDGSTPLRRTALEDWARLERAVPGVLVRWSGSLALMRFNAPPGLLRRLLHCPWGDFRQTKDGMLLAAAGTAKKDELQRNAHATLQRLKKMLIGANDIQLSDVRIGARPMPVDGLPIVGSLPAHQGAYIAVMHSAVTLAPAAGRLVADEVIHGLELEELEGVGPHRFATAAEAARASSDEPPVS
jgi:glycine/D-amino acid oxidase-like deaminating enzyme